MRRTPRRAERGQSAVELALLLPVLAAMVFGIVDLGRAFYFNSALANAAREGARYCAIFDTIPPGQKLDANRTTATKMRINQELGQATLTANDLVSGMGTVKTSQVTCDNPASLEPVLVRLNADFRLVTPLSVLTGQFSGSLSGTTLPIQVSATMMKW